MKNSLSLDYNYWKNHMRLKLVVILFVLLWALTSCNSSQGDNERIITPTLNLVELETPTSGFSTPTIKMTELETPTPGIVLPKYQLTFVADQPQKGYPGVYAMDVGCLDQEVPCFSEPYLLFENSSAKQIYDIAWSPNGKQIAYAGVDQYADIFISDWNGENTINLTNSDSWDGDPIWMPDGSQIIYKTKVEVAKTGFVLLDLGEQTLQGILIETNTYSPEGAVITPDSKKMIFMATVLEGNLSGYFQIFISDLDGSNLIQLTENPANYFIPSLSPDGSRIVVEQEYNTEARYSNLVEICLDGSCFDEITEQKEGVATMFPAWAPFDDWIAYCYNFDLYLTKSDGSITIRLTQTSFDEAYPAWRIISP